MNTGVERAKNKAVRGHSYTIVIREAA
jgi:hypothetical protein